LLTHAGCPYICRYIWSGYAGTTINRLFNFCIYSIPEVGSMNIKSLGGGGIRPRKRVVLLTHAVCPYICHLYGLATPAPRPVRNINNLAYVSGSHDVGSSQKLNFYALVGCCRFPVLQIRVVSCPASPISIQLEPIESTKRTVLMDSLC